MYNQLNIMSNYNNCLLCQNHKTFKKRIFHCSIEVLNNAIQLLSYSLYNYTKLSEMFKEKKVADKSS